MTVRIRVIDTAILPNRMETTPEGFLICRGVPLARTGEQTYYAHEIPGVPHKNGMIVAVRDEDEVFAPEAIASFWGKIFTDDHPNDDVTTANFRPLIRGAIMNSRRGEGDEADKLLGDIIVYDPSTIAKIRSGKREVSNGYDADYEVIEPGRARQVKIRGNHVSLVDEGRCGPACAIRDRKTEMPTSTKPTWKDRLFRALRSKDEAEREELLKGVEADMPDEDHTHEGDGHHITINVAPPGDDDKKPKPGDLTTDEEEGDNENQENTDMDEDKVNALIVEAMKPFADMLKDISEKVDAIAPKVVAVEEQVAEVAEAVDDMSDPEDMATQDAVARAAILAPNLQRPTTDAKPGSKSHRDAMGSFKKDALRAALTHDAGRAAVNAVLGHTQPHRIAQMTPAETAIAFRVASQMIYDHNATRTASTLASATSGYVRDDNGRPTRPMTPADLQANANAFYKRA